MTVAELRKRTLERLDEDPAAPVYYQDHEVFAALSEGERLFALLTLALEEGGGYPLTAGSCWYDLRAALPRMLVPLRVRIWDGPKLRPAALGDLDALDPSWQLALGTPTRYGVVGSGLLYVYPAPDVDGISLEVVYAQEPPALETESASPLIPEEYHQCLVDYAVPRLKAKEGGAEFLNSLRLLDRFLERAAEYGNYMRERGRSRKYDKQPFELERFSRGRLIDDVVRRARSHG